MAFSVQQAGFIAMVDTGTGVEFLDFPSGMANADIERTALARFQGATRCAVVPLVSVTEACVSAR